ncbi:DUF6232 family protein [Streptomyces sp. NPDC050982]|uniref:DUF6232 family protein n=1 Tax=Streptomyces sp. NPDC050982 TaxID=3154746 RepID=UPI0033EE0314
MAYSRGITEVQVSKGALWVASDTYPLRNIARTSMREIVPDYGKAKAEFVKKLVLQLILVSDAVRTADHDVGVPADRADK